METSRECLYAELAVVAAMTLRMPWRGRRIFPDFNTISNSKPGSGSGRILLNLNRVLDSTFDRTPNDSTDDDDDHGDKTGQPFPRSR